MGDHDGVVEYKLEMIEKAAAFGAAAEMENDVRREKLRRLRAQKSQADLRKKKFKLNLGLFDNACTSACDEGDAWRQARLEAARAEKQKQERLELQAMAKSGELNREVGQRTKVARPPLGSGKGPKSPKKLLREAHHRTVALVAARETYTRRFSEYGELLESIESGAIAPLRGSYVVALSERGEKLRRRQELPAEAFFPAAELQKLIEALPAEAHGLLFVALSYRWLTPSEPDPSSFHLAVVADVARLYLGRGGHPLLFAREKSPLAAAFDSCGLGAKEADFALFWDVASLCQSGDGGAPRSPEDEALYLAGRKASAVWYAHEQTVVWQQKAVPVNFRTLPDLRDAYTYGQSGWTYFESLLASSIKLHPKRRLDIGRAVMQGKSTAAESRAAAEAMRHAYGGRGPSVEACCLERACLATERYPLLLPDEMATLLSEDRRYRPSGPFGNSGEGWEAEAAVLGKMYAEFFHSVAHTQERLIRRRAGWGDPEVVSLARSLPSFAIVREIDLQGHEGVSAASWRAFGDAVVKLSEAPPPHNQLVSVTLDGGYGLPIKLLRGKLPEPPKTSVLAGVGGALIAGGSPKGGSPKGMSPQGGSPKAASGKEQQGAVARLASGGGRTLSGGGSLGGAIGGALIGKSKASGHEPGSLANRIAEAARRRTVERIDLSGRQLGVASAAVVAACLDGIHPSLGANTTITDLDCSHNPLITGEAAEQLGRAVLGRGQMCIFSRIPLDRLRKGAAKPLAELELFNAGLGPAEGHVLGSILDTTGGPLTSLNLAYNHLGADGATAIANALYRNDTLMKLNLEQNEVRKILAVLCSVLIQKLFASDARARRLVVYVYTQPILTS